MNRLEAIQELRKKQTAEIEARWIYDITGTVDHPATDAEPWTRGKMVLNRTHRSTGVVRYVADRVYMESNAERAQAYARANELTQRWTAFDSFTDLLRGSHTGPACGYKPSLRKSNPETRLLADYYDAAQVEHGDSRRSYRS